MPFLVAHERRLERLPGAGTADGRNFEWQMAGLVALRAYEQGLEFEVFSNVVAARPFGDLVFRLRGPAHKLSSPFMYFIQLKHSRPDVKGKTVTEKAFTSDSGNFSLRKYFEWFQNLRHQHQNEEFSDLLSNTPLENVRIFIFTTKVAPFLRQREKGDEAAPEKPFPYEQLFYTSHGAKEDALTFNSSCQKVWQLFDEDKDVKDLYQQEFLACLKVFCNQAYSRDMKKVIEKQMSKVFGKNAKIFLQPFLESLQEWTENNDYDYCLSNKILTDFFGQQLRNETLQSVCKDLEFKPDSLKNLRAALRKAESSLRVAVKEATAPGSRAVKVLQSVGVEFGGENWLYVNASILKGFNTEALIAAVRSVKVVIHDVVRREELLRVRELLASLEPASGVLEVAIGNGKSDFEDCWRLQDLCDSAQQKMLERLVTFHGDEMHLEDLQDTWTTMQDDVGADFLASKGAWCIGKQIEEPEDEILDRCLSHHHEVSAKVICDKEAALNYGRLALLGFPKNILKEAAHRLEILKPGDDAEKVVKDNARWTVLNFEGKPAPKDLKMILESLMREKSAPGVHLVEYLSGGNVDDVRVIWRDSAGQKEAMQAFVLPLTKECEVGGPVCLHRSLASLEHLERFLLVGPAGYGKSTTISCFASHLQKKNPTQWIIFVKILKHQQLLRKWKDEKDVTEHHVVELLAAAAGAEMGSPRRFLENSIKQKGALSIFIDGVDKVAPDFKDIVILLLKKLLEQRVNRVWVATRPEVEASLRLVLQSPPLALHPLSTNEQRLFIRTRLTSVKECEQDERVEKIMNLMVKTGDLLTTPLHLVMTCQIFNTETDSDFESNFTMLSLYEKFIEQKRRLYEEKFSISTGNLSFEDNFEMKYCKCAVVFLFADYPLEAKLPIQEYKEYVANDESLLREKFGIVWLDECKRLTFIHQTFAEYFAAKWFLANTKTVDGAREFVLGLNKRYGQESRIQLFLQDMLAEEWPLHAAAWRGDMKEVQRLMEERGWGSEEWHTKDPLLQWTWGQYVQWVNEEVFFVSSEERAVVDPWRCAVLKVAAFSGCNGIVAELLRQGNFPSETLRDALREAAVGEEERHSSIVETLLENGVEDKPDDDGVI